MVLLCLQSRSQAVTLNKDFNTGTLTQGIFLTSGLCNQPHDGYLTDSFSTDGGKSFRTEVRLTDTTCGFSKRSEMNIPVANTVSKTAEWFAFDTYVPTWQPDDVKVEGFVQYHTLSSNPPPFLLAVENGVYQFRQFYKPDGVTVFNLVTPFGTFPKGQWNKFVVHYKRSLGSDGLIELWCNGTRYISKTGPNACLENGAIEPTGYFKFGMYKWVNSGASPSQHGARVVYVDNIKVGNATATISDFVTASTPPVVLSLTGTNNLCSGGTTGSINAAVSGGTPPFTYLWSNGAVTPNISALASGTYSLTVTDAASRTATSTFTVTSPALLTATATAGIITTVGGSTTVTVAASGGTSPYTGTGNFTVTAGTYTYPVTDANGCAAATSVTVSDFSPGGPFAAAVDMPLASINCYGGSTTVNVSATGGTAPYTGAGAKTVSAGNGSLKVAFTTSTPNSYSLMYFAVGPVSSSKNYVLKFTTLGTTNAGKLRASLRQTATPFTVFTAKQAGVFGTTRKDHQFVFKAPATQTAASFLIEIDQSSGTTYFDNIAFFESDTNGNIIGNSTYANNQFEASIANIFVWSGNNNQTASWDNTSKIASTYYFPVTDAAGAFAAVVVNTTQASIPLLVTATASAVNNNAATVTVNATGGVAPYTGTGSFTVAPGTYTYPVTDANGCVVSASVTIQDPGAAAPLSAVVDKPLADISCFGGSTTVNVTATGGTAPYTGTGAKTVSAGKGTLKVAFTTSTPNVYTLMYSTVGAVSSAKNYVLRFTTLGTTAAGKLRASLRLTATPFTVFTAKQSGVFGTTRKDHQFIFKAPATQTGASFLIEVDQSSGTTYFDNIAFFESDTSGNIIGNSTYVNNQFETNIANIFVWSGNNNQTASWDNTSKIASTHYFTVTDATGKLSGVAVNTVQPSAQLNVTADATAVDINTNTATVTVNATGGTAPYAGTGSFIVPAGTYTYTVTDAKGCTATVQITVSSLPATAVSARPVGGNVQNTPKLYSDAKTLPAETAALKLTVFPNPSSSSFNIIAKGYSNKTIDLSVFSFDGRSVYKATVNSNGSYTIGSNFRPGVYTVKAVQGTVTKIIRIVKAGN